MLENFVELYQLFNQDQQIALWNSQIAIIYDQHSEMYVDSEGQLKVSCELTMFANALLDDLNMKIYERIQYLSSNPQAVRKCPQ